MSGENGLAEDIVESIKQKDQARFNKLLFHNVCIKDSDLVIFAKKDKCRSKIKDGLVK